MKQFTPSTEVDFVVIGSGAAGASVRRAAQRRKSTCGDPVRDDARCLRIRPRQLADVVIQPVFHSFARFCHSC